MWMVFSRDTLVRYNLGPPPCELLSFIAYQLVYHWITRWCCVRVFVLLHFTSFHTLCWFYILFRTFGWERSIPVDHTRIHGHICSEHEYVVVMPLVDIDHILHYA